MANYETRCPHCGSTLNVSSEWEGMELACPLCSKNFTLPKNAEPANNDEAMLLLPKTPAQEQTQQTPPPVVPRRVIPQQVIPQQYPGYQQPQMPPPGYQQPQYPGAPQMPPAPPRKAPAFLTSYKFYSIIIAVLLLIGGIFIINAFQGDDVAPDGASIAADKKRHDETVKKLEAKYIGSMIEKSKEVKTYKEAFAILDQLVKDFPSSSARSKIDERLQALEKENATIIFESNNNNKRTYMIFKYSYDLEEKFKNIKAGFYNMREINVKKRELSRTNTLASIGRYEQDVKEGYLKSLGELRELIAAKKHLFLKSHNAKRYTVTDVPPGKYIWIAYSLESKECWWGAPTKVHRKNVLYTLD